MVYVADDAVVFVPYIYTFSSHATGCCLFMMCFSLSFLFFYFNILYNPMGKFVCVWCFLLLLLFVRTSCYLVTLLKWRVYQVFFNQSRNHNCFYSVTFFLFPQTQRATCHSLILIMLFVLYDFNLTLRYTFFSFPFGHNTHSTAHTRYTINCLFLFLLFIEFNKVLFDLLDD